MKLNHQNLHAIATAGCGFNAGQLHILGVTDMSRGWLQNLIGTEIDDSAYAKLMELKGLKRSAQKKLVANLRPYPKSSASPPHPSAADRLNSQLERLQRHYSDKMPVAEFMATLHRFPEVWMKNKRVPK